MLKVLLPHLDWDFHFLQSCIERPSLTVLAQHRDSFLFPARLSVVVASGGTEEIGPSSSSPPEGADRDSLLPAENTMAQPIEIVLKVSF